MALIAELEVGETITVGQAVIEIQEKKGRTRVRLRIEAPTDVKIVRGESVSKAQECHITQQVRGDTHVRNTHRSR